MRCCSCGISSYSRQLVTRSCTSAAASMHCSGSRSSLGMSLTVSRIKASAVCCGRARTAVCRPVDLRGNSVAGGHEEGTGYTACEFSGHNGQPHCSLHCSAAQNARPQSRRKPVRTRNGPQVSDRRDSMSTANGQPAGPQHTNQDAHSCIIRARRIYILPKVRVSPGLTAASLC